MSVTSQKFLISWHLILYIEEVGFFFHLPTFVSHMCSKDNLFLPVLFEYGKPVYLFWTVFQGNTVTGIIAYIEDCKFGKK